MDWAAYAATYAAQQQAQANAAAHNAFMQAFQHQPQGPPAVQMHPFPQPGVHGFHPREPEGGEAPMEEEMISPPMPPPYEQHQQQWPGMQDASMMWQHQQLQHFGGGFPSGGDSGWAGQPQQYPQQQGIPGVTVGLLPVPHHVPAQPQHLQPHPFVHQQDASRFPGVGQPGFGGHPETIRPPFESHPYPGFPGYPPGAEGGNLMAANFYTGGFADPATAAAAAAASKAKVGSM